MFLKKNFRYMKKMLNFFEKHEDLKKFNNKIYKKNLTFLKKKTWKFKKKIQFLEKNVKVFGKKLDEREKYFDVCRKIKNSVLCQSLHSFNFDVRKYLGNYKLIIITIEKNFKNI